MKDSIRKFQLDRSVLSIFRSGAIRAGGHAARSRSIQNATSTRTLTLWRRTPRPILRRADAPRLLSTHTMASACAGMVSVASLSARQVNGVRARQPVRPRRHIPDRAKSTARSEHRVRRFPSTSRAGARGPRRRRPLRSVRRRGVLGSAMLAPSRLTYRTGRPSPTPRGVRSRSPAGRAYLHPPRPRKPSDALSTSLPRQVRAPVRAAFAVRADAVRQHPRLGRKPHEASRDSFASRACRDHHRPRVPEVSGERDARHGRIYLFFETVCSIEILCVGVSRSKFSDGTFSAARAKHSLPPD